MAKEQMRPASPEQAPDPATNYERARPEKEAGMGRLDNDKPTPQEQPDDMQQSVKNRQDPNRQTNAANSTDQRKGASPNQPEQPDHSMLDEEPLGWDQAPTDIKDPKQKRHPRKEGKGGTE